MSESIEAEKSNEDFGEQLLKDIDELRAIHSDVDNEYVNDEIYNFAVELDAEGDFPRNILEQTLAWHRLIGSTPEGEVDNAFEGKEKVENRIRKFLDRLLPEVREMRSS